MPNMASQFHNCIEVDLLSLLEGDLAEIWKPRTRLIANNRAIVALFEDGSSYYRVNDGVAGIYDVCESDQDLADSLVRLGNLFPKLALQVQECIFSAFVQEAAIGNSLSRESC